MPIDNISPMALRLFVYAVAASLAECEQAHGPIHPRTLRETLLLQISRIENREDFDASDRAGVADLRNRVIQMADDPDVRDNLLG